MSIEHRINISRRPTYVAGGILILMGILALLNTLIPGIGLMIWAGALALIGVGVFGVYLTEPAQKGILIPAYILWAMGGLLGLLGLGILNGIFIPVYILSAIALPFVYGFARNPREYWGLLIPTYVMGVTATFLLGLGANTLDGLGIPAYWTFAVGAPFLLTFALNRRDNWWALIPGGIMTAISLGFLMGTQLFTFGLPAILIGFGILVLLAPTLFGKRGDKPLPQMEARSSEPLSGPAADKAVEVEARLK